MGVKFATPDRGDAIVAVARNAEGSSEDDNGVPSDENIPAEGPGDESVAPAEADASTDEQPGGSE
jgi:DNA gyrase subunit A